MALFRTKNHEEDEDTETVTIPDFVEDKTSTSSKSVDMSIFKLSDKELYDDVEEKEEDDEEEETEGKKGNGALIFCIIMIVILLACAGAAAFFAYKEHKNYVQSETEVKQLMAKENEYKTQIAEKDNLIASLNKQIEELTKVPEGTKYIVVDGGMVYRKTPETDGEYTSYNGKDRAENDDILMVLEVIEDEYDSEMKWAKLADNIYVCIEAEGEVWAKAQ